MDSDVTADSLSSPEHGGTSAHERGSGFGSMLSFSTQGPPDHASSQRSSGGAVLDSFDLSPATDASSGGDFLDMGSRQQRASLSLPGAGGLTPLSESRKSSHLLLREGEGQITSDKDPSRTYSDINLGGSVDLGIPKARADNIVVGITPEEDRGDNRRIRKRSREAAMTDGRVSVGWQQSQQSQLSHRDRLESSWPLFQKRNTSGDGSQWSMSQPSPSASSSQRAETTSHSPPEYVSVPQGSRLSQRAMTGVEDVASLSGFLRDGESNEGEIDRRGSGSDNSRDGGGDGCGGDGCGGGGADSINNNREGMSVGSSEPLLSGGIGETFSIVSEVSSRGLPAPPLMPSGPLPAIGAIREVGQ